MLKQLNTYYYSFLGMLLYASTAVIFVFYTIFLQNSGLSVPEIGIILGLSYIGVFLSPLLFLKLKFNIKNIQIAFILFGLIHFLMVYEVYNVYYMILILFLYGGIRNTIQTYIDSQTSKTFKEKYGIIRGMGSVGFLLTTFFVGLYYSNLLLEYFVYFITISSIIIGLTMGMKYKNIEFKEEAFDFSIITDNKLYWTFILVYHISLGVLFSFLSIYLIDRSYEMSQLGNIWNISVLSEIIMLFTFVLIANKLSINNFIILAIIMTIIRFLLLYIYPENYVIALGAQVLHLFTFPIFHINTMKTIERLFPNNMKMGLKSYFAIGYGLSLAIGSFLGSYIYGDNLFLYVTGITLISLVLWFIFNKVQLKEEKIK